jgi:hypothetical protein
MPTNEVTTRSAEAPSELSGVALRCQSDELFRMLVCPSSWAPGRE